jgi:hypothetical protein
MGKYKQILDELYKEEIEDGCVAPCEKLEYVGGHVFDFTTYDGGLDIIFAKRMLEVIECVVNKTTFDYIQKSQEHYENYILMCNSPFLVGKLEWGTSIRGAWLDEYGHNSEPQPRVYKIGITNLKIPKKDIVEFCKDLLEWVNE